MPLSRKKREMVMWQLRQRPLEKGGAIAIVTVGQARLRRARALTS